MAYMKKAFRCEYAIKLKKILNLEKTMIFFLQKKKISCLYKNNRLQILNTYCDRKVPFDLYLGIFV